MDNSINIQPPVQASKAPTPIGIHSLPPEVLVSILEHLDYLDLKSTIASLNKDFRSFLERNKHSSGLARKLLINRPVTPPLILTDEGLRLFYILHPLFAGYQFSIVREIERVLIREKQDTSEFNFYDDSEGDRWTYGDTKWKYIDINIGHENFTQPAVTNILITNREERMFHIHGTGNGGAVTVRDVIQGYIDNILPDTHWCDGEEKDVVWEDFYQEQPVVHLRGFGWADINTFKNYWENTPGFHVRNRTIIARMNIQYWSTCLRRPTYGRFAK